MEIFRLADKDNSGTLTVKEIKDALEDIYIRYPQVELYLKTKQMKDILDLIKASKGDVKKEDVEITIEEFKNALADVDSQVKNLPATAQVFIFLERFFIEFICGIGWHICYKALPHLISVYCHLQVAAQQGNYLARCFNKMNDSEEKPEGPRRIREPGRHRFRPFRYLFEVYALKTRNFGE